MNKRSKYFPGLVLGVVVAVSLAAQTPLPPGESLVAGPAEVAFALRTQSHAQDAVRFETVESAGPDFTRAWRIATLRDTKPMASIELRALNARPVAQGDVALIHFYARATEISDETGGGRVLLVVRRNGAGVEQQLRG